MEITADHILTILLSGPKHKSMMGSLFSIPIKHEYKGHFLFCTSLAVSGVVISADYFILSTFPLASLINLLFFGENQIYLF